MKTKTGQPTGSSMSCPVCDSGGTYKYRDLRDYLFDAPGLWQMRQCLNEHCRTLWLDPPPAAELMPQLYRDYYTHADREVAQTVGRRLYERAKEAYLSGRFRYPRLSDSLLDRALGWLIGLSPSRRDYLDAAAFHAAYVPSGHLLEIGCGSGTMLAELARRGWIACGVELDPQAARAAARKGLDVRCGTVKDADFPEGRFDLVAMVHVIEHVMDPRDVIEECFRILKPGGKLVIVTPNAASFGARFFGQDWRGLEPPRHVQIFGADAICAMMNKCGFDILKVATSMRDAANVYRASYMNRRARLRIQDYPGVLTSLICRVAEGIGRALRPIFGKCGEEISLVAVKPLKSTIR